MIVEGICDRLGKLVAAGICGAARQATQQAPYLNVDSDVYFTDEQGNQFRTKTTGLWPKFMVTVFFNELLIAEYEQNGNAALTRVR